MPTGSEAIHFILFWTLLASLLVIRPVLLFIAVKMQRHTNAGHQLPKSTPITDDPQPGASTAFFAQGFGRFKGKARLVLLLGAAAMTLIYFLAFTSVVVGQIRTLI